MQQRNKSEKIGWNKSESWKQVMKPIVLPFKYRWISYSDSEGFVPNYVLVQGGLEDSNGFTKFMLTVKSRSEEEMSVEESKIWREILSMGVLNIFCQKTDPG